MKNITVEEWVAMFKESGLDQATMKKWHKVFEARHPESHQAFLEWLGVPEQKINQIRIDSK